MSAPPVVNGLLENKQIQTEVKVFILDHLFRALPTPSFPDPEKEATDRAYRHIWQESASGLSPASRVA